MSITSNDQKNFQEIFRAMKKYPLLLVQKMHYGSRII